MKTNPIRSGLLACVTSTVDPPRRRLPVLAALTAAIVLPSGVGAQIAGEEVLPSGADWDYLLYAPDDGGGVFTPADPASTDAFDLSAFENEIVIIRFQFGTDSLDGGDATITWNSRAGFLYAIDFSADLANWFELDDGIESEGDETSYTDRFVPAGSPQIYYRVRSLE